MESKHVENLVGFVVLRSRLRDLVNARLRNGEFTERGLAKLLGISQPQMHNVLKGARTLTPELSDSLMFHLGISIADLLTHGELAGPHPVGLQTSPTRKPPSRLFVPPAARAV